MSENLELKKEHPYQQQVTVSASASIYGHVQKPAALPAHGKTRRREGGNRGER